MMASEQVLRIERAGGRGIGEDKDQQSPGSFAEIVGFTFQRTQETS